jgi:hypothetical protein
MGIKASKASTKNIDDYSIVSVPKNYTMLKIISYYIDLRISANVDFKVSEIINYIMSNRKNKYANIINLQGINDVLSLHLLIRGIKKYCIEKKITMYFAPEFDDIDADDKSEGSKGRSDRRSKNLEDFTAGTISKKGHISKAKEGKHIIHNVIISTYPIVGTIYSELDDKTNMDDIFGIQTVIGANILIDEVVISVYNTCLSKDIRTSNFVNDAVRKTELEALDSVMTNNKKELLNGSNTRSNIHIIVGNLHIPEIANDNINNEYISSIKNNNFVDIFRYKLPKDFGYTTSYNERSSYILLDISQEIYDNIQKTDHTEVLKLLFNEYKIHIMDMYVVKNNRNIIHYPLECIFMIKSS